MPKPKVKEEEQRVHDFGSKYREVSIRTFERSGGNEEQPSIEAIKESEKKQPVDSKEVDDDEEDANDFETPDEYLVSR